MKFVSFVDLPILTFTTLIEYVNLDKTFPIKMKFNNNKTTYYVSNSNLELPDTFTCQMKLFGPIVICTHQVSVDQCVNSCEIVERAQKNTIENLPLPTVLVNLIQSFNKEDVFD